MTITLEKKGEKIRKAVIMGRHFLRGQAGNTSHFDTAKVPARYSAGTRAHQGETNFM